MNLKINEQWLSSIAVVFFLLILLAGCGSREEKASATAKPVMAPAPVAGEVPATASPEAKADLSAQALASSKAGAAPLPAGTASDKGIAAEVDGIKLTTTQLNKDMNKKIAELKGQIPADSLQKAKAEIKKVLIDEFVTRTILDNEIGRKKITATDKEINEIMDEMKTQLPPGVTMEELLKKNKIDAVKMREEIAMNLKINKLVLQELGGKVKIADKEISEFYNKNLDKFKQPESVHARHLLIAFAAGDTDKIKAEKKAKAEEMRKKMVGGADFADLATKNSDCPSKQNGGDLGTFTRGQMVKPFEEAAFSQEKNAIGPVVATDFGYHIIQVLDHTAEKVTKLDGETKKQISAYLENQKQQETFGALLKKLKASANIVVYGK